MTRSVRAFTFVEIAVAMLILGIGLVPVFWVFIRSGSETVMSREEIMAHNMAGEMLDLALKKGYDIGAGDVSPSDLGTISVSDPQFSGVLNVQEIVPKGGWKNWPMSYKVVTARVTWTSQGIPRKYALTTLLFRGINQSL